MCRNPHHRRDDWCSILGSRSRQEGFQENTAFGLYSRLGYENIRRLLQSEMEHYAHVFHDRIQRSRNNHYCRTRSYRNIWTRDGYLISTIQRVFNVYGLSDSPDVSASPQQLSVISGNSCFFRGFDYFGCILGSPFLQ